MYKFFITASMFAVGLLSAVEDSEMHAFFRNPNQEYFAQSMEEYLKVIPGLPEDEKVHLSKMLSIHVAQVIHKYPNFLKEAEIRSNYPAILQGIKLVNSKDPLLEGVQIKEPGDLDYLWVSYFATGEVSFVKQIYEFLRNCSDTDLAIGYEFNNRIWMANFEASMTGKEPEVRNKDLYRALELQSKSPAEYQTHLQYLQTISVAQWSIGSILDQYPELSLKIKEMLQKEPDLDWSKRVRKCVFNQG